MRKHFSGYCYNPKGTATIVASGTVNPSRTRMFDGCKVCALEGPRGGLRGWVLAHFA